MTCEDCKLEDRVRALEEDSRRNQVTHKEFFSRFEAVGKDYTRIDAQYGQIIVTMGEIKADVGEMKAKPGKRWEAIIAAVISGVVAFVVAWVLRGGT